MSSARLWFNSTRKEISRPEVLFRAEITELNKKKPNHHRGRQPTWPTFKVKEREVRAAAQMNTFEAIFRQGPLSTVCEQAADLTVCSGPLSMLTNGQQHRPLDRFL